MDTVIDLNKQRNKNYVSYVSYKEEISTKLDLLSIITTNIYS